MFRAPGRNVGPGRFIRPRWLYPTAIVLGGLAIGSAGILTTAHWPVPSASAASALDVAACASPVTVDVAATPRIHGIVSLTASHAGTDSSSSPKVSSEEAAVSATALPAGVRPDLWLPDSTIRATAVNGQGRGEVPHGPSSATSPRIVALPAGYGSSPPHRSRA